ncbi:glucosaminidase domain-containing protein [Peptoanaerobacter stomatis]|uniref:glucosaminidase domain-containing protein n=1 Tax=Peptoanaerobacter stomatis TaxID=796937 RepID=UPI003FA0C98B
MGIILSLMIILSSVDCSDIKKFDYKTAKPYQISFASEDIINEKLKGTYLEGCGNILRRIELEYGVNWRFIYAIGKLESGGGKYLSGAYNYFGIKNLYDNKYRDFYSKEQCVNVVGMILGSDFYKGRSIGDINNDYCPADSTWASQVREIMLEV